MQISLTVMLSNHVTKADPSTVSIAFPVESNAINAPATIRECVWDTRKSFAEFWGEMCKNMQLDQTVAALGYKFTGDRVKDPPRALSTAEDYRIAMEEIQRRVRTARTKEHKLVLHNLVGVPFTHPSCTLNDQLFTVAKTVYRCTKEKIW